MDEAMRAGVVKEALTWLGTPYHHHARVKGVGVDCAQLLCAVYEACGCVPHIDPGNYAHDWHLHRGEEVFIGWLEKAGAREVQAPAPGDVAIFRYGRAYSHGAVVVNGQSVVTVVHSYLGRGVTLSRLDEEPLQGRVARFWSMGAKNLTQHSQGDNDGKWIGSDKQACRNGGIEGPQKQ